MGPIGAVKEPFSRNESVQRAASSSQHAHSVVEGLVVENGNVLLSKLTERELRRVRAVAAIAVTHHLEVVVDGSTNIDPTAQGRHLRRGVTPCRCRCSGCLDRPPTRIAGLHCWHCKGAGCQFVVVARRGRVSACRRGHAGSRRGGRRPGGVGAR